MLTTSERFKNLGLVSVTTCFYLLFVILFECKEYRQEFKPEINLIGSSPISMIQNVGLFIFAIYTIDCIFMVRNNMKAATSSNILKLGASASFIALIPFLLIGIFGYYSLGQYLENIGMIPDRPTLQNSSDIAMNIAKYT